MPIHSILPPEAYEEQPPFPPTVELACPYGILSCTIREDGSRRIERLISTDPAAYLDPLFSPGGRAEPAVRPYPAGVARLDGSGGDSLPLEF